MSAICGIYHCDGRAILPEDATSLMGGFSVYTADSVGSWQGEQIFLGCHAQYITPESMRENLPYHDKSFELAITADAIIDNRTELFDKLAIQPSSRNDVTDSQLILHAYQKWGHKCPEYLIGDFAFVIWDGKRQELFCAVDHTGTRSFYYYRSTGLFAFSTLINPLFALPEITKKHSETWIADFLAMPCVMHQLDPELTLYQDIFLLPAGHHLTVRPDRMVKQVYWKAKTKPKIKLKSDTEYEAALLDVLSEAVRCRLRSVRPVAVMMSGGLDSTSVACLAARELAQKGQRLLAFTAVPMSGYRDWLPVGNLADESAYVEAVREYVGNIDVVYCRSEGKHPLSDTERILATLEQPYKIFENMYWNDSILAAARERNIGVVLNGGAGNLTVSWGSLEPYLLYLFRTGRWNSLFREVKPVLKGKRHPLRILRQLMVMLLPYEVQKIIYQIREPDRLKTIMSLSPINPDFAHDASVEKRFRRFGYDPLFIDHLDSRESRVKMLGPDLFSHMGPINTKLDMAYGMIERDPTMDKRVIEFCLSVPEQQFIRDGNYRYLLRRAMAGLLPEKVRLNTSERGLQSADWAQRIQPLWPAILAEIEDIGTLENERKYLNLEKIKNALDEIHDIKDNAPSSAGLRMLIRSLIFSRFMRRG